MKPILTTTKSLSIMPQMDLKHNLKQLERWRDKDDIKCPRPVYQIDVNGDILHLYRSMGEAERSTGARRNAISRNCRGLSKTCGGFKWEFAE